MTSDHLTRLHQAVAQDAGLRRVRQLQPIGGKGDKIFPPTYPPFGRDGSSPRHIFERRRVDEQDVWCVLIDSVQSQANRLEEVLLAATRAKNDCDRLPLPVIAVDFEGEHLDPLKQVTSLDAPHRVYDAILRDSLLEDTPFMDSEEGKCLAKATPADATAMLELAPTSLLFGAWHSQGQGGGLGAKFPRALVSEIMGINTPVEEIAPRRGLSSKSGDRQNLYDNREMQTASRRAAIRSDPLGILKGVPIYQGKENKNPADWSDVPLADADDKGTLSKPSRILHGNIISAVQALGVTCDYAEHRAVITFAGLRRLYFGDDKRDIVGRTLIASLGLVALTEQDTRGYALRSRCDLVCEGLAPFEIVLSDGSTEVFEIDRSTAREIYLSAYEQAQEMKFELKSLTLKPQPKLVHIIRQSRDRALEGTGGENGDD